MRNITRALACAVLVLPVLTSVALADTYIVDPGHTQVTFTVERFGFNYVIGAFDKVTGTIELDEDHPENSRATISIDTTSLYTGNPERDAIVHSKFWLNTEKYPTIIFTATSVEQTGGEVARVTGDLTLMGVTNPITLDATLNKIGTEPAARKKAVGFSATAHLKRSDYGLSIAVGPVGDDIAIQIEILAIVE